MQTFCVMLCFVSSSLLILSTCSQSVLFNVPNKELEKNNDYWYDLGRKEIEDALVKPVITKIAKNIIFFLGDGMGVTATTAGRIYYGQTKGVSGEEGYLSWEKFPNVALIKTYNLDKQVPDSAATATSYFGGVKANFMTLGVNGKVKLDDCQASLDPDNHVNTILKWCQDAGKETGIITTARITHATPAALYTHIANRNWECDSKLNESKTDTEGCKDIARQLVQDLPGKDVKLIFGGGRNQLGASVEGDLKDAFCTRTDEENLVEEWLDEKGNITDKVKYVTNNEEFRKLKPEEEDYVMGLFSGEHMPFSHYRDNGPAGTPSLSEVTEFAIKRLRRSSEGYFLMVEGGRIDHGLHATKPHLALEELLALNEAIETAVNMTDPQNTLIIATADHSHVMTMNGYPDRGNDIFGKTDYPETSDHLPYTTLMFTNGEGANFTWDGKKVLRANLTDVDTTDPEFMPQAAVPVKAASETHGGEDVAAYAKGPMAHMLHRLHEQSYIAHVMGYAACVGPYVDDCDRDRRNDSP